MNYIEQFKVELNYKYHCVHRYTDTDKGFWEVDINMGKDCGGMIKLPGNFAKTRVFSWIVNFDKDRI